MGEQYSALCCIITTNVHHHHKTRASKILRSIEAVNYSYLHNDLTVLAFIAPGHSAINYCIDQETNRETKTGKQLGDRTGTLERSYPIAFLLSFYIVVTPNSGASGYNCHGLYSYFIYHQRN